MKPIKVVCGIIWKGDQVFIARRKAGKALAGFWEFPGGKLEKDEPEEAALVRELQEELGMQVNVLDFFGSSVYDYETFSIELISYSCNFIEASYKLTDHDEVAFVRPVELGNYKIAPADQFIVERLAGETYTTHN
jgi:8-oxo-dGTP diphosphatase